MPGTVLRFEVDTVFRAADVKTQTLCMPTQVMPNPPPFAHLAMASATHIAQASQAEHAFIL